MLESWPGGISAITLFVENLEETKQFYREAFGLPIMFEDEDSAVFKFEGALVNLLKATAARELIDPAAGTRGHGLADAAHDRGG